jgi:hypothetical protein
VKFAESVDCLPDALRVSKIQWNSSEHEPALLRTMMRSKTNPFVMLNKVQTVTLPNVPGHMLDQKLSCNWAMNFKQTNTMKLGPRVNNLNANVIEEVADLKEHLGQLFFWWSRLHNSNIVVLKGIRQGLRRSDKSPGQALCTDIPQV